MLEDTKKLHQPGKGHKRIVKKEKKTEKKDDRFFDPDAQKNWLFNNDYKKKKYKKRKK
jgi:hypothetical protein